VVEKSLAFSCTTPEEARKREQDKARWLQEEFMNNQQTQEGRESEQEKGATREEGGLGEEE
jgi:hypothetical protein